MVNDMETDIKLQAEFNMLCDEHNKLKTEFFDMKKYFEKQAIENEIMKAQLEMVYLIFGGRNCL